MFKRRHFLQFAGTTLATFGLSYLELRRQGDRYGQILSQNTPRKLALLVGINQYPSSFRFTKLKGCSTDVTLQRELLINRFGFNDSDIVTLRDQEATRDAILTSFDEHLIGQAKPGDVVVFHFSGHGSRIADPNPIHPSGLNSTFVPADDHLSSDPSLVNDIMGRTLFLLMAALRQKTENVTFVLDSCHSGGGTRGNIRVRAIGGGKDKKPSPAELATQEQWLQRIQLSPSDFQQQRQQGVATGIALASAQPNQEAADYRFSGFYAGAFTYLITQYLWQQTDAVERVIASVTRRLKPLSPQVPLSDVKPNSGYEKQPTYFLPQSSPSAEAVITDIQGNQATLWLGGINHETLEAFEQGAIFNTINPRGRSTATQVKLLDRKGLMGTAIVSGNISAGTLLQESTRVIPVNWELRIGLDPSLGDETAAAVTALQTLNRITPVLPQGGDEPYPKEIHYILGRMTEEYRNLIRSTPANALPTDGSLGLFSPALELIPKSFGVAGEPLDMAMSRLIPKLKALLAARIIKLTLNGNASRLDIAVVMELVGEADSLVAEAFTPRGCHSETDCSLSTNRGEGSPLLQQVPLGTQFRFRVVNREPQALYLGILALDPAGEIVALFPNEYQSGSEEELIQATRIDANQTLIIPDRNDEFDLKALEVGRGEMLIIASQQPLNQALLKLKTLAEERGTLRGVQSLASPVALIETLIDDLSGTRSGPQRTNQSVSTKAMAALAISFEVIET